MSFASLHPCALPTVETDFPKIRPFALSFSQITSLLEPNAILTNKQRQHDDDRYQKALDACRSHTFAVSLLAVMRSRLGLHDPITRGLVSLLLGDIPGVPALTVNQA